MCWVVVTPIAVPIEKAYNISSQWVAFIPMSFMIFYLFGNFPSNWVIDVKGIRKGIMLGSLLTFIGCAIRCLVKIGFPFVIVGQCFAAIGQPFIINAPMKIATRWFMPQNVNNCLIEQEITRNGYTDSCQSCRSSYRILSSFIVCIWYRYWRINSRSFLYVDGCVSYNSWSLCLAHCSLLQIKPTYFA